MGNVVKVKMGDSKKTLWIEKEGEELGYKAKADEMCHVIYSLLF
jgi:hypothetical protein